MQLQELAHWWLTQPDLVARFGNAIDSAIQYVLDGGRSGRFTLKDKRVDPDERRSVGTKLQFHIIEEFNLPRLKSPDTKVGDITLDIKGTVGENWTIPVEGQCEICLLVRIDTHNRKHQTWLMRTHRKWLHNGDGNGDQKRGIAKDPRTRFALPLYLEASLPPAPLTLLNEEQLKLVFSREGQTKRLVHLFSMLQGTVVNRATILTVCAGRDDPIRRAREAREPLKNMDLALLCGAWTAQRTMARELGQDLSGNAWVAVPWHNIIGRGSLTDEVLASMNKKDVDTPF
ncbi:NaeI family type II restriction endonuclease [Catenuloplanes sp. NPDC051500]|uniref:NaeI family type II restriction endonuclease n=1 Tax=Catenuloplanes sp. NPDC051500 TaxID=3363959 RepID=UPI0037893176